MKGLAHPQQVALHGVSGPLGVVAPAPRIPCTSQVGHARAAQAESLEILIFLGRSFSRLQGRADPLRKLFRGELQQLPSPRGRLDAQCNGA